MSSMEGSISQSQLDLVRLEGVINTRFAELRADNQTLFSKIDNIEASTDETANMLKDHLGDNKLHLCDVHGADIDKAFDRLRELEKNNREDKVEVNKRFDKVESFEKITKIKLRVLAWVVGAVGMFFANLDIIKETFTRIIGVTQ